MPLKPIAGPSVEPITLPVAKAHLRVQFDDDDALIAMAIGAARRRVEAESKRALVSQTWELLADRFPCGELALPLPPLLSVASVKFRGTPGVLSTLDPSAYEVLAGVHDHPGLIYPVAGSWPSVIRRPDSVQVRFVAGYGADGASVPETLRWAMLLLIGHYYENREAVVNWAAMELPRGVADLIRSEAWGFYATTVDRP